VIALGPHPEVILQRAVTLIRMMLTTILFPYAPRSSPISTGDVACAAGVEVQVMPDAWRRT